MMNILSTVSTQILHWPLWSQSSSLATAVMLFQKTPIFWLRRISQLQFKPKATEWDAYSGSLRNFGRKTAAEQKGPH